MNPEEGELRPQLLDRFGMCVTVEGIRDPCQRVEVMRRRLAFEADPEGFAAEWDGRGRALSSRIAGAVERLPGVRAGEDRLLGIASTCLEAGADGHRGDLMMLRAAKALAAWHGRDDVDADDVADAATLVLPHRMRRQPMEAIGMLRA